VADLKMTGLKDLEAALLEMATKEAKRIGKLALRNAAKPILSEYKARTKVKTGDLVSNESAGTRLNKRQRSLTPRPGPSEIEIHIGTADPGGIMEEFGNRNQVANPALTPAWDKEGGETALRRIGEELGAGIERFAARAKKG
jgi:hypothetical protein